MDSDGRPPADEPPTDADTHAQPDQPPLDAGTDAAADDQVDKPAGERPTERPLPAPTAPSDGWPRLARIAELAGLPEPARERLRAAGVSADSLDDAALRTAVDDGIVSSDQARALGLAASLVHLVDGDEALARHIATETAVPLRVPADLARLDRTAWAELISAAEPDAQPPSVRARASDLTTRVARLFPTDTMLSRLLPPTPDLVAAIEAGRNGPVARLAGALRDPELADIATDANRTPEERADAVAARLEPLRVLRARNPGVELLDLDLGPGSADVAALDWSEIAEHRPRVLQVLRAQQRDLAIAADADEAHRLLAAGFGSALDVTAVPISELGRRCDITEAAAARLLRSAVASSSAALAAVTALIDANRGDFDTLAVGNLPPSTQDYVRRLTGFAEIFGDQAHCRCTDCGSVLSPSAYFVDLMHLIQTRVSDPVFAAGPDHPLHLKTRRPDLWNLDLSCGATRIELPSLELVDEILENYVARAGGYTGDLADRAAVQARVYPSRLAQSVDSLRLPFVLPLRRLEAYLPALDSSRTEVVRLIGGSARVLTCAVLGLSGREYDLISTPQADLAVLRTLYDIPLPTDPAGTIQPFDSRPFLTATGLDHDELVAFCGSRFVAAAGAPITLVTEKSGQDSVQNDVERVHGATPANLDRLHRMLRLARHTTWTVGELDLVLSQTAVTTLQPPGELDTVAALVTLQQRLQLDVETTCALMGPLPVVGTGTRPALRDRAFNRPPLAGPQDLYPQPQTTFLHPALRDNPGSAAVDATSHRLQGGLAVTAEELLQLIRGLATGLGANLAGPEPSRGFTLTDPNLSLLFRHAQLARVMKVDVPTLFALLAAVPGLAAPRVTGLADLLAVLDFADWWSSDSHTLDDLAVIRRGSPHDPAAYPNPATLAADIRREIVASGALTFADTAFAFLDDITEEQSRQLIAANATRIRPTPDGRAYRLAADFDLGVPITVPADAQGQPLFPVDLHEARALLARHHPAQVLPAFLAGPLAADSSTAAALLRLAGANLSSGPQATALHGDTALDALTTLLATLVPLRVLFSDPVFDAAAIDAVATVPGTVGLDLSAISVDAVRQVGRYATLARAAVDGTAAIAPAPGAAGYTLADLRAVLAGWSTTHRFRDVAPDRLGRVAGGEPAVVAEIAAVADLRGPAAAALTTLVRVVALARRLGVGGAALAGMTSDDHSVLERAADTLQSALRARYPESAWAEQVEPVEDGIRVARRDALADLLLHSDFPEFTSLADLYQHFLIDVEVSGCARTTRLVAGISSAQLYVNRVRMTLEQDRREPQDPAHLVVPAGLVDGEEWSWRRSYRIWEANRRVFLTPESYLEPTLRDDKTPLFRQLESTLLQQPIDEQSVLDAYTTYLAGFDELAALRIGGSYHDIDDVERTDILHLFGVTSTDPPRYYHRTAKDARFGLTESGRTTVWSPWQPIDVQIPSSRVSPIVHNNRLHVFWVGYATKPTTTVMNGTSTFIGYRHGTTINWTSLRLDRRWTAAQKLQVMDVPPFTGDGVFADPLTGGPNTRPLFDTQRHAEPRDGYGPRGVRWERLYVELDGWGQLLGVTGADFARQLVIDTFGRRLTPGNLWRQYETGRMLRARAAGAAGDSLFVTGPGFGLSYDLVARTISTAEEVLAFPNEPQLRQTWIDANTSSVPLLVLPQDARLQPINGSLRDIVIDDAGDLLLLQGSVRAPGYVVRRIGTTLGGDLSRLLAAGGVDLLLALATQQTLGERPHRLSALSGEVADLVPSNRLDLTGPYGSYMREIFFHVPFLIADHLHSQGQHEAAQKWYHRIFDPASPEPAAARVVRLGVTSGPGGAHVVRLDEDGALRYLMRAGDGTWRLDHGPLTAEAVELGRITDVACTSDGGPVHVCAVTADGGLWHTVRQPDGTWQSSFGDVRSAAQGGGTLLRAVACAANEDGDLQVCAITADGRLLHTLRSTNGGWTPLTQIPGSGVVQGAPGAVSCAAEGGRLHVCFLADAGALLTITREPDGSWTTAPVEVASAGGGGLGTVTSSSCAARSGELHVCLTTQAGDRMLFHTVRTAAGWSPANLTASFVTATCTLDHATGRLDLLGAGSDGRAFVMRRLADGTWQATGRLEDFTQAARDRNWRYLEFRGLDVPRLRAVLTDPAALAAYRRDPFNPHAIARLRIAAYQKAVVMKYVVNLLDWADAEFTRFTSESVAEATMLYQVALAVLGDRPAQLGDCADRLSPLTYSVVSPALDGDSDFLIEVETMLIGGWLGHSPLPAPSRDLVLLPPAVAAAGRSAPAAPPAGSPAPQPPALVPSPAATAIAARVPGSTSVVGVASEPNVLPLTASVPLVRSITRTALVFCIPHNRELIALWDRVEDRLDKIRTCRDITGVVRRLPSFPPEIDPAALVRAKAAGLSPSEALGATSGDLPPYRFAFLIDRAKAQAATVQAFGSALLSALERRDLEELNRLQLVQQQNLVTLGTRSREWEIELAENAVTSLERQQDAVQHRRDFHQGLLDAGRTEWENVQSVSRHTASGLQAAAGLVDTIAGIAYLVPQLGSPFAMKYGGQEVGNSANAWATVLRDAASVAEALSASAALEAGFQRREEGWRHEVQASDMQLKVLQTQLVGARRRVDVARRGLAVHVRGVEQLEELSEFYRGKLTGLGLYSWLSSTLLRVYREAYNGAYALAALAEQAFKLERGDVTGPLLAASHWDSGHSGLLAGELLMLDLQAMERRYLETNYRELEIDQPFSLGQLDPVALVRLRELGTCEFQVPELAFDLAYPGHYRRLLKAVRVTVPCVVGPYTNVSASLTLLGSQVRIQPDHSVALTDVPLRRSTAVALSSGQQDAGVLELSLRDERYVPFEKSGALSQWRFSLPSTFRPFDYRTITDVILHLSYTAQSDERLRGVLQDRNAQAEGSLRQLLTAQPLTRVFSLRSDLPGVLDRLMNAPAGTEVRFRIGREHLPYFLPTPAFLGGGKDLVATSAVLTLVPAEGVGVAGVGLRLDDTDLDAIGTVAGSPAGLPAVDVGAAFVPRFLGEHKISVTSAGALAPAAPSPLTLDPAKLHDAVLTIAYRLPS